MILPPTKEEDVKKVCPEQDQKDAEKILSRIMKKRGFNIDYGSQIEMSILNFE